MATNEALSTCSDEELLERFRRGRREAFEVLLRRYERELFGYLRRYLRNAELAEDVFQNTFLQLFLKADRFEPGRRVRPWLYTIASHQAIDAMRRMGRRQAVSLDRTSDCSESGDGDQFANVLSSLTADPHDAAEAEERRRIVRATVDELPEFLRQVVILGYYQGLKYQEIADILDIPLGTVKSRLHTAMQKLHEKWSPFIAAQELPA